MRCKMGKVPNSSPGVRCAFPRPRRQGQSAAVSCENNASWALSATAPRGTRAYSPSGPISHALASSFHCMSSTCSTCARAPASSHREHQLQTAVQIARHPVRAGQIEAGVAAVFKAEHPAVLQKTADDGAHANLLAQARNAGAQAANAADNQQHWNAGAGGVVEHVDNLGVHQGVHFCRDAAGKPGARVFRFRPNQRQER